MTISTSEMACFNDLPSELRIRILSYLVLNQHPVTVRTHDAFHRSTISRYSLVSMNFRELVRHIYYGQNTVQLSWYPRLPTHAKTFRVPPLAARPYIHHLELKLCIPSQPIALEDLLDTQRPPAPPHIVGEYAAGYDVLTLVLPQVSARHINEPLLFNNTPQQDLFDVLNTRLHPQMYSSSHRIHGGYMSSWPSPWKISKARTWLRTFSQWQTGWTNLFTLKIVLELDDCMSPFAMRKILTELGTVTETQMQARSVEIDVRLKHLDRHVVLAPYKDRWQCTCMCATFVERMFRQIMKVPEYCEEA